MGFTNRQRKLELHVSFTYLAGKLASARTISSPCPILNRACRRSGDKIFGIPFKRPILIANIHGGMELVVEPVKSTMRCFKQIFGGN